MLWSKLLGVALCVLSGLCMGRSLAEQPHRRSEIYAQLCRLCSSFLADIPSGGFTFSELLHRAAGSGQYPLLELERFGSWQEFSLPQTLPVAERQHLERLLSALGTRELPQTLEQLGQIRTIAAQLGREQKEEYCKVNSLYTKLGGCAGLMLAVFLL